MTVSPSFLTKAVLGAYRGAWQIATPFLRRNKRLAEGFDERILKAADLRAVDIWLHAASTGEAYLAADLAKALLQIETCSFLFTTQTAQGRQIIEQFAATQTDTDFQIRYLPLDSPPLMNRFVRAVKPKVAILIETELWPSMLRALKQIKTKVMIANGRMTQRSFDRMRWVTPIWKAIAPDIVLAISNEDGRHFSAIFGCPVTVVPNMKFDQLEIPLPTLKITKTDVCAADVPLVVLGSVRKEEAQAVGRIIQILIARKPDLAFALFPKHVHQLAVWKTMLDELKLPFQYRSQMERPAKSGSVILGDTVGELKTLYGVADAVFVGGSLAPLGGHNFLEPLLYGRRPVMGPYWDNFKWVGPDLFDQGFVKVTDTPDAAAVAILQLLVRPDHAQCQAAVQRYFATKQGGTDQTVTALKILLRT